MSTDGYAPGDQLPELEIPIDRSFIVAGAIASQDFEDVHHDPDAARRGGSPDIFISINTSNGVVDRYITDWAGPTARMRSVSLRLGMPLHPGDVLRLTGEIVTHDSTQTTVKVVGSHARGAHLTAKVSLSMRAEAAA